MIIWHWWRLLTLLLRGKLIVEILDLNWSSLLSVLVAARAWAVLIKDVRVTDTSLLDQYLHKIAVDFRVLQFWLRCFQARVYQPDKFIVVAEAVHVL